MLPKGWKKSTINDLFEVQLGKMLNKAAKAQYPQFPYLSNSNVRWGTFDLSKLNEMYFSEREIGKFTLKHGDLIVCEGGEVGRCAIWKDQLSQCYFQKALHRLRPKGQISPTYFQLYMTSIAGTKVLEDYTTKTSIAHLTREKLLQVPVKLPPLPEQTKIAKILSTWDKAINTVEKLIENSKQQKKSLMQQLLTGKTRFKEFGEPAKNGKHPKEWSFDALESHIRIHSGYAPSKYNLSGRGKYPYIKVEELNNCSKYQRESRFYTDKPGKLIPKNTVLFPKRGAAIMNNKVRISDREIYIDSNLMGVETDKSIEPEYLYYTLVKAKLHKIADTSTIPQINNKHINPYEIFIPPLAEQNKISQALSKADEVIELHKNELTQLKQEKTALMQQLLTGKRRVKLDTPQHAKATA